MQFKKLRRSDRKKNNRKEDSGFVMKLLAAPKHPVFTSEMRAQCVLCIAQDSLAGRGFPSLPCAGQGVSATQEIKAVVSQRCYLPCLILRRASNIFAWQKFSLDGAGTAITHHSPVTSPCCLWI